MKSWWLGWVVGVFLCFDLPAQAQITPGGSGTVVNQVGHQFNITGGTQSGRNLFHSFYQFGLNQGQVANFFSNPAIANILARVNGGSVSYINGLIQVLGGNSNLFLMNPAGIIFGPHASLNVPASFTATTADRIMFAGGTFNAYGDNQYSQLVGEPIGFVFSSSKPGIILNEGNLQVNPGQSLNLLAGQVINTGTLTAPGGSVSVTAVPGERWVRLSQPGHLLSFEFDRLEAANVMVDNNIPILRLPELVGARGAQSNSALTVQNNTVKLGNTTIPDQSGTAIISGKVDVSATNKTGGQVNVLGRQIALLNSEIDASGEMGGGKVFIGGNFQGKGPLPNAEYTLVDRNSTIKADALRVGNGGEVIVWADKTTQFYGTVSAKGGVAGGNGGFVEVSGKENLTFDGRVDTSAPQGRSGTLLLDPKDIFIVAGSGSDDIQLNDAQVLFGDSPGATFTIGTGILASQLSSSNVTLEASNNITFTTDFFATSSAGTRLSAKAGNSINVNGSLFLSGIELKFTADGTISTGNIFAANGITLDANGGIRTGHLVTAGGDVGVGSGLRTVSGNPVNIPAISQNNFRFDLSRSGVQVSGGGDIQVGHVISQGGDIGIATVRGRVDTGDLDSSSSGNAGNIGVAGSRDVTVRSARAESSFGQAGSVVLGSLKNVRVTGVGSSGFSISTRGGSRNGGIGIVHSGQNVFSIGNASVNGTAGAITTGLFTLASGRQFSSLQLVNPVYFVSNNLDDLVAGSIVIFPLFSFFNDFSALLFGAQFAGIPIVSDSEESSSLLDTSDFARLEIAQALGAGDFNAIVSLDGLFEDAFRDALGVEAVNNFKSVGEISAMLAALAKETGKRTAIVYIMVDERQLTIAAITPGSSTKIAEPGILQIDPAVVSATQPALYLAQIPQQPQPIVRSLPQVRRSQIIPVVERFLTLLKDPRQRTSDAYLKDAQQLYRWLIAPIEQELQAQGIDTLLFAMDSGLRLLPVAALHDGKQFLVEKYSTALIPSVNLVDTRYRNLKKDRVLAMGADRFAKQAPLPAVPVELKVITQEWPGQSFLNQDFTVQRLIQERLQGDYAIVHLATHADFVPGRLSDSYIEFGNNQRLLLPQVRTLPLRKPSPVELFTLSACRTAVGDVSAELGFAGLAVQAGVKSALASLWYVSDEGTLGLMSEFYRNLRQTPIKAEALRQAQMAMLRGQVTIKGGELRGVRGGVPLPPVIAQRGDQDLSHPYHWAAFTMIGSPW